MVRPQVAAQAQAQHQTSISHTESLELVRCLLRVSIFHVSYLRGLFPEKSFKGVDMKNLDDMHIKMLLPACDESKRLVDWVEGGVYDAIKRGYLKNLFFGISTDPEGTELLEEYIFSFRYGDGKVAMDMNAIASDGSGKGGNKKAGAKGEFKQDKADLNTVRYQVCRLIRMLVQVCRTLDKVPAERYLFMKLTYQDETPDDYEPPYFIPVDENGVGHFKRSPFSMAVGKVSTDHHTVSLKVKSTLDSCDDELVDGDGAGDGNAGNYTTNNGGANDRVTAQAQPSAGSVGSGDAGTTMAETADQGDEAAAGAGEQPPASHMASEGGGEAMEEEVYLEATAAPLPSPSAGAPAPSGMTDNERQPPKGRPEAGGAMDMDEGDADDVQVADAGGDAEAQVDEGDGEEDDVTEAPDTDDYLAVCEFVKSRSQVSMRQLGRQFGAMSQGALGGYVSRLTDQGLLLAVPGARNTFRVVAPPLSMSQKPDVQSLPVEDAGVHVLSRRQQQQVQKEQHRNRKRQQDGAEDDDAAMLTERLDGLSMGAGGASAHRDGGGSRRRSRDEAQGRDQHEQDIALQSRGAQLESKHAGDEQTGSQGDAEDDGGRKRQAEVAARGEPEVHVYIMDSQVSGAERKRGSKLRKASYVADPIQQGAAKRAKQVNTTPALGFETPADKGAAMTPRGARGSSRLATMKR